MASFVVKPLSIANIRQKAAIIRDVFDSNMKYFPIVPFLENIMPQIFEDFYIEIDTIDRNRYNRRNGKLSWFSLSN